MNKTLFALAATACLIAGCGDGAPTLKVDLINKGNNRGILFDYMFSTKTPLVNNRELTLWDFGFDGTLDSAVDYVPKMQPHVITPNSSDFSKYDSMYHEIREMATIGRVWELR